MYQAKKILHGHLHEVKGVCVIFHSNLILCPGCRCAKGNIIEILKAEVGFDIGGRM